MIALPNSVTAELGAQMTQTRWDLLRVHYRFYRHHAIMSQIAVAGLPGKLNAAG